MGVHPQYHMIGHGRGGGGYRTCEGAVGCGAQDAGLGSTFNFLMSVAFGIPANP